jgi:hypothetical protein
MKKRLCAAVAALITLESFVFASEVNIMAGAQMEIDSPLCEIQPKYFMKGWTVSGGSSGAIPLKPTQTYPFSFKHEKNLFLTGEGAFSQDGTAGVIHANYSFVPKTDTAFDALCISLTLSADEFTGGTWTRDAHQESFPAAYNKTFVGSGACTTLVLRTQAGRTMILSFPQPTAVMVQDDRQWGNNFSVRIGHNGAPKVFKAGEPYSVTFSIALQEKPRLVFDSPIKIQAGTEWIPLTAELDLEPGSAVDFSKMGFHDAPAGKYGYTLAKGPHFVFEKKPDSPQRFYGVNVCFSANFPEADQPKRLARRLAMLGYNAIRIHHHDGGFVQGSPDDTTLNPDQMAKWDALIAACINEGLYVTTDLYVSRSVKWKTVGIDRPGNIAMNEFKVLVAVHEGAWENLKQFTRNWMQHVNPHTGRAYKDEPALAWLALINEGNFGNFLDEMRAIPEWQQAWSAWLAEKRKQEPEAYKGIDDALPKNIYGGGRPIVAFKLFLKDMEMRFVTRAKAFLRDELKCRALVTNMSCWTNHAVDQIPRDELYDYVDDHFYVDHPRFIERQWNLPSACENVNPIKGKNMGAQGVVHRRLLNKPFTVTEYNFSSPGQFRGLGGIVTGALGALQDWSGIWRFCYSHSSESFVGTVAPKMNYFDMVGDPLSQAAERASLCLFVRQDLPALKNSYAIVLPKRALSEMQDSMPQNNTQFTWLAWYAKMGTVVAEHAPSGTRWSETYPRVYTTPSKEIETLLNKAEPAVSCGDGALQLDRDKGTFILKTPRTCGGFAEQGTIDADALSFVVSEAAATVWVSALDQDPVRTSSRLLLTHLTDIQNSDITFAEQSRKTLLAWGRLPHLVRKGQATISLALKNSKAYTVYALSTSGKRTGKVSSSVVDGKLCFTAATDCMPGTATLLYEITRLPQQGQ